MLLSVRIMQTVRYWVPDRRTSHRESPSKHYSAYTAIWREVTTGRSDVVVTQRRWLAVTRQCLGTSNIWQWIQTVGQAREKARVQNVLRRTNEQTLCGVWQIVDVVDCELRTQADSIYGEISWSPVQKTRWTVTANLYCILWGTVSQCRSSCISHDRPRSYFWVPVMRHAAAFKTDCI